MGDMSRGLCEELEQRRANWQRDVERMQQDFFKVATNRFTSTHF